ncbi:MAG: CAP domain-containing protein [Clostridiales bacterium]|nr:CAP domain-containing protein [Clostridiales bacterium]
MSKRFIILPAAIAVLFSIMGAQSKKAEFASTLEREAVVEAATLNVRTGPGMTYPIIGAEKKGAALEIIGAMGNWYLVKRRDDSIGMVSSRYVRVTKIEEADVKEGDDAGEELSGGVQAGADEELLFRLVNEERVKGSLEPFEWDERLNKAAQTKLEDMLRENYFGHNSPNYGTPFSMLKQLGITYKTASENLSKDKSVELGYEKMMGSLSHRANMMSMRFNKMGVAVGEPDDGGKKAIVQIFIEELTS